MLRKALELTFEADELNLVTHATLGEALATAEEPALLLVDTVLGTDDGYAAGKALKARFPAASLVFLTSRHAPLDAARALDAGSDGHLDKPFDSQVLLDKAHQLVTARGAVSPPSAMPVRPPSIAAFRAPAAPIQPNGPRQISAPQSFGGTPSSIRIPGSRPSVDGLPSGIPAQPPRLNHAVTPTPSALAFPASAPASVTAPSAPTSAAQVAASAAAAPSGEIGTSSTVPPRTASTGTSDAEIAAKLAPLNLSDVQQAAVITLTRALVEQVVWEVVPSMAEAMIREELARLTR